MNKFKKLGLTALGTTLVASSAFAGEITASGDAGYTWSSESVGGSSATPATGTATNDGIGYNHDITMSGSGELDNGWSVSTTMIFTEDSSLSSSNVALTMGGLGTVKVGNGTGSIGSNYDNALPTAYEENHDGQKTTTAIDSIGSLLDNGGIDYTSPAIDLMGASITLRYGMVPEAGDTATGEGGVSTAHATYASGSQYGANISYGGFEIGGYYGEATTDGGTTGTHDQDATDITAFVKYTAGPVSIGYQEGYIDRGLSGSTEGDNATAKTVAAAVGAFDIEALSVAFNVNENFSISYQEVEETYDAQDDQSDGSDTPDVAMESTSIQFAYTMGTMSIKGYQTDTDNPGWDSDAKSDEVTELAVNFAF
jgi:outer membrane protein OmpU